MKQPIKLTLMKGKGLIRHYLRKPLSACLLIVSVALFVSPIVHSLFFQVSKPLSEDHGTITALICAAYLYFTISLVLISKNQSIFFKEDAYYLYIGPYSNMHILKHGLFNTFLYSVGMAILAFFILCVSLSNLFLLPADYLLYLFWCSFLICFFWQILASIFYIEGLIKEKNQYWGRLTVGLSVLSFLRFVIYFHADLMGAPLEWLLSLAV